MELPNSQLISLAKNIPGRPKAAVIYPKTPVLEEIKEIPFTRFGSMELDEYVGARARLNELLKYDGNEELLEIDLTNTQSSELIFLNSTVI